MSGTKDGPPITVEQLAALPLEFQTLVRAILDYYEGRITKLQAELARLRAEVIAPKQTPQNSSLPPSTQHPHARPKPQKPRSPKQRGGQPGHPKHERSLIPVDQCDDVQTLKPTECRRCSRKLSGCDPEPLRHQVWEVPEIRPHVTEYQQHRLSCPDCGESTCAELPPGVPSGQSGPRLVALAGLLMACFRQSKRRTALFLESILNQPCCPALTVKMQAQVTAAVQPAYQELVAQLATQEQLYIDESPTHEHPHKAWLWAFIAAAFSVFAVRATRAATVLTEHLGASFRGLVNCDRAKMYWCVGRLQWCWAHLKRDFQALVDSEDGQVRRLGRDLMRPTRKLFSAWARYRDGTLTRIGFRRVMNPIRREIESLLLRGVFSGNPRLIGMCEELYNHRAWLWTFVEHEGVEPTNNAAERALRHGVIWRKLSFGTKSAGGSRFVETMLSVIETCRQQERPVFDYLTTAVAALFADQPAPSLLPRA